MTTPSPPAPAQEIIAIPIEEELQRSYLDYAMSVIIGRALPDVRDGLKPVHRRILYAMQQMGNDWNKPYKKSARVVGNVIGQFHPHGDVAVYDSIVRMAQPFSLRYPLINGQGNFGSIDGDRPAAMRYTEVRMSRITHELLADLDKETVDFIPNYDGNEQEPTVLPTKIPNLLINGSSGIAVGMATNIPPHNVKEVLDACFLLIEKPSATVEELLTLLPGPDFPTAAIITGRAGILEAYKTGKGKITIRAKTEIETDEKTGKQTLLVKELPFQVNKALLIAKIAELLKDKKIEGISSLRDESDKDGLRVVIELKRGEHAEVLQNNLLSLTQLQISFGINMVALIDGQPRLLPLKNILEAFLAHRRQIVTRRTLFELKKARERAHILESLAVALSNIDAIITLIKQAKTPAEAKEHLLASTWPPGTVTQMLHNREAALTKPKDLSPSFGLLDEKRYQMTPVQAQAILDLRLHRLTSLEREKILKEYGEIILSIQTLLSILASPEKLMAVVREELQLIKTQYQDKRRTEIISTGQDLSIEDLIEQEEVAVTLSHTGYIKAQPIHQYESQHRGGKGRSATQVKTDDFIERLLVANTHDTILCFSNLGKAYWLKVYQLPQGSSVSKGKPIVNLLSLSEGERITTILPIKEYTPDQFIVMATGKGLIKKTALSDFSNPRANGIIAIHLQTDDMLIGAHITNGERDLMLFTDQGKVIRFHEKKLRATGRTSQGVRGIRLPQKHKVIALLIAEPEGEVLTVTRHGYGKRTAIREYRLQGRGGSGVISIQVHERNGPVVSAIAVQETDDVMLVSDQGKLVRTPVQEISVVSRNTKGVRLIQLSDTESLVAVERIEEG
ncbi:MAG: DNA gyrase subunit A [Gammaproteobacteria bacterium]|nr:DNA gyrase subunit A [Gammaproteobacteria bacterium]